MSRGKRQQRLLQNKMFDSRADRGPEDYQRECWSAEVSLFRQGTVLRIAYTSAPFFCLRMTQVSG